MAGVFPSFNGPVTNKYIEFSETESPNLNSESKAGTKTEISSDQIRWSNKRTIENRADLIHPTECPGHSGQNC